MSVLRVHAVQGQDMQMHVEPKRTVRPLDNADAAGQRVRQARQREQRLGATMPATSR